MVDVPEPEVPVVAPEPVAPVDNPGDPSNPSSNSPAIGDPNAPANNPGQTENKPPAIGAPQDPPKDVPPADSPADPNSGPKTQPAPEDPKNALEKSPNQGGGSCAGGKRGLCDVNAEDQNAILQTMKEDIFQRQTCQDVSSAGIWPTSVTGRLGTKGEAGTIGGRSRIGGLEGCTVMFMNTKQG